MILARQDLWERAANDESVRSVWNSLCLVGDEIGGKYKTEQKGESGGERAVDDSRNWPKGVDWTKFFDACRIVANSAPDENIVPFDVDMNTAESLSCLVLEVWASIAESRNKGGAPSRVVDPMQPFQGLSTKGGTTTSTLRHLLAEDSVGLYLSLLHVIPLLTHLKSTSGEVFRRSGHSGFASSREWYSTSSSIVRQPESHRFRLLRLPGSYSTRGDWYLAVAKGSRSRFLGERAIDLLSSRRLGLLRTQDGLGLPVRDIFPDSQIDSMKTAITRFDSLTGKVSWMTYGQICQLGVNRQATRNTTESNCLKWLWRSQIPHYARDSFFFRRWLGRLIAEQDSWLPQQELISTSRLEKAAAGNLPPELNSEYEKKFLQRVWLLESALKDDHQSADRH